MVDCPGSAQAHAGGKTERARAYVVKLGEFFSATPEYAGANSIMLGHHARGGAHPITAYMDFQALRFADALEFREEVSAHLHACLQTLVENALTHGFPRPAKPFELTVLSGQPRAGTRHEAPVGRQRLAPLREALGEATRR